MIIQVNLHSWRRIFPIMILVVLLSLTQSQQEHISRPPFLDPDTIYNVTSQFQFNLIINENRNFPIFFLQYSKDSVRDTAQYMLNRTFEKEPGISFALIVDCRNFQSNLNRTLGFCGGFDPQKAQEEEIQDLELEEDKRIDNFFVFYLLTPDPTRIKQKGHQMSKNHNIQNLRQHQTSVLNDDYLVRVLRNEIADFVSYIEDNYDMEDFLETKGEFRTSKKAKLLYFDQNLQSPLFVRKLATRLDGKIKMGVTDNFKLAKKYSLKSDSLILMEYNFIKQAYDTSPVSIHQGNELNSVLQNEKIRQYIRIKKSRDMMLDFEHREIPVYIMSTLSEINQLMTHGRVIVLEVSREIGSYYCPSVTEIHEKYSVMFNYVCFSKENVGELRKFGLNVQGKNIIYVIDESLESVKSVQYDTQTFSIYDYLPRVTPRQKISTQSEAKLCLKTAITSQREPIIYWYNQRQHKNTLKLLQYFNSLSQVTSLLYFCQVYLPDDDLVQRFQLKENSLFSMMDPNPYTGEMKKLQFTEAVEFLSIKMFLRQISIGQMMKVYEQKLKFNTLKQINSAEDLTRECFNQQCIVGLMATKKFRFESQMQTLKELKRQFSQQGYNFLWIDGECHWDVAKQLKLLSKKQKQIDRSYLFYYKEKSNQFSLMTAVQQNKYWVKKDVKKWIKSLKQPGKIKSLKFGIDIEDKKCIKQKQVPKQMLKSTQNKKPSHYRKKNNVNQGEL